MDWQTNGSMEQWTNKQMGRWTDGQTQPFIEMLGASYKEKEGRLEKSGNMQKKWGSEALGGSFNGPWLLWRAQGPWKVACGLRRLTKTYISTKKQEKSMEINENQLKSMQLNPSGEGKLNISNFCHFQRSSGNCSGEVISHASKWL